MLSGLLKNFMDRTCPVWTSLEGKLLVGIAVAEEGIGKAVENLKTYGSVCGMRWGGYVTALAKTLRFQKIRKLTKRFNSWQASLFLSLMPETAPLDVSLSH